MAYPTWLSQESPTLYVSGFPQGRSPKNQQEAVRSFLTKPQRSHGHILLDNTVPGVARFKGTHLLMGGQYSESMLYTRLPLPGPSH